jgi:FkbM family methyltransferase
MEANLNKLYKKCIDRKIPFEHVCEVGVYLPQTSNIINFINDKVKTTLVEPDPKSIDAIKTYFKNKSNIQLYPHAIFDYNGTIELVQRNASTFVGSLKASPSLINDGYQLNDKDKFSVECKKFDEIDDGTIDLLSVDTEGCEWYVLKNLKSRPKVISVETHFKAYINPFHKEIKNWTAANNYVIWYKSDSDTVYIDASIADLTKKEKIGLKLKNFSLFIFRLKYIVKHILGL